MREKISYVDLAEELSNSAIVSESERNVQADDVAHSGARGNDRLVDVTGCATFAERS
jgi:hypothetical protein